MDVSNLKRVFPSPGREQYLELGMSEPSAAGESSNNKSPSEITRGVSPKSTVFTFMPVMRKLPIKNIITDVERIGSLAGKLNENSAAAPDEKASSEETMSADGEIFKAEVVYIKDWEEGGAGNNVVKRRETEVKRPVDRVSLPQTSPSVLSFQAGEDTALCCVASPAAMDMSVNKHGWDDITPLQRHGLSGSPGAASDCSSGFLVNRAPSAPEDRTSPTGSTDMFPTLASSRESILSEGWDRDRSWWSSPVPTSRTGSPCSSVRSGMFSPSVVRVTRHSLAPGSSLIHMPSSSCFSSCESLSSSSSACPPLSPPPPARRRPPLTRLSLLTAILRKGRLPILSPALQRPYSPCWPINHVSLSSCRACSAASSLAPIPLAVSRPSSAQATDKHFNTQRHGESLSRVTSPAPEYVKGLHSSGPPMIRHSGPVDSNGGPKWERVMSPPPPPPPPSQGRRDTADGGGDATWLQQVPLPRSYSPIAGLNKPQSVRHSVDPTERHGGPLSGVLIAHSSPSGFQSESPPGFKPSRSNQRDLKGPETDHNPLSLRSKLGSQAFKPNNRQEFSAPSREQSPQQLQRSPRSRSDRLSSKPSGAPPPCCPAAAAETRPSVSPLPPPGVIAVSPAKRYALAISPPPLPHAAVAARERPWRMEQQSPPPARAPRCCLPPSRYTPIVFTGWPSPTHSRTSTPDRFTSLSPSPAAAQCDRTPSPSLSVRSTPSPRAWIDVSDCVDREGKARKLHKIKFSYKSLAAIPTNTLLQDQQTIDEQVEREDLHDSLEMDEDTHVQMCSPAQLRQQSEELYAVIDGVLEDSVPKCQTSHVPRLSRELANKGVPQPNASPPRFFLGHETKYALCSLSPPAPVERKLMDSYKTKPGCIRPMSATPRLTVEDNDGEHRANPFRQYLQLSATDNKKSLVEAGGDAGVNPEGQQLSKVCPETASTFSMHNSLLITEPQDRNTL